MEGIFRVSRGMVLEMRASRFCSLKWRVCSWIFCVSLFTIVTFTRTGNHKQDEPSLEIKDQRSRSSLEIKYGGPTTLVPRPQTDTPKRAPLKSSLNKTAKDGRNSFDLGRGKTSAKATHVRFLKVHKAGSTTMQNLLFRFGLRNRLNIVVTSRTGPFLKKTADMLKLPPGQHYNILALHTKYSKTHFSKIMPDNFSVNIGIVRYPPDRLVSAAYYHRDVFHVKYLTKIPKENFIRNLINYPDKYDRKTFSQTRNQMGYEFGFPSSYRPTDHDKIRQYLEFLSTEFKLVLIMEKFDESLVLMKRLLHWDTMDIIYLKTNSHQHQQTSLNSSEVQKVRETCFLDFAIYDYFKEIFEKKVKEQGKAFKKEVTDFRNIVSKVSSFCEQEKLDILKLRKTKWHGYFTLNKTECDYMKLGEVKFLRYLKQRHLKTFGNETSG